MAQRFHTCMLCEAVCGLTVDVETRSVRGDPDDPFSRGHICPKAAAIFDVQDDADRIREPQRREGDAFRAISWKAALEQAGARIAEVQRKYGRNAVGVYLGNPSVHSYAALLATPLFNRAMGTRSRFSATSVDQLPAMLASLEMFGHQLLLPIPDVDRTSFFLMLGANPLASNGSLMTAGGISRRLDELKKRGGELVVVDPRRTETAQEATRYLPIRPGTDALLLLAMLHVLFAEQRVGLGHLKPFTDGLPLLQEAAQRFPPERVAARTGIGANEIRKLARDFAAAPSAVAYGRVGTCTQAFGGLTSWLIVALNAVTGNLDREGGFLFTTPAADLIDLASRTRDRGHFGVWKSRVRGLPEFGGELPAATLAEEIDTEGDGRIRALVTFAGNPVLSTPNGARLDRALSKLDFMVSIDLYRNETTRHANLILPTSFGFERDHYDLAFYALAVRNAARYARPLVRPPRGVRGDFEVLLDLAMSVRRHGGGKRGRGLGLTLRASRLLGARRVLDLMLRFGPHRLSLRKLLKNPHGIDLGPLRPQLPGRLGTRDKRIALAPKLFLDDLGRLEASLSEKPNGLVLIGRRALRSNNSWMHNSHRLVKGPPGCVLYMHPEDAAARGVVAGGNATVESRVGKVEVPVALTDDLFRGVVSLPHGWGHAREGAALSVARAHPGASLNDLTDEQAIDALSGNAAFSGIPVTVRKV
ncbi:MAG: molybdopterin oxidoreductase family protein [Deltaproteobacteria bacterium]|nr:MAG: molybdopterin oxidoreductase family protein [Deltaproteobacteria bacterium]